MNGATDKLTTCFTSRLRDFGWVVAICALPLVLLWAPRRQFGADWAVNLWLTSYFGEFFKQHLAFPEVIHTTQLAGIPYPVFYGFLLYPVLGLASSATNPHAALRLAVGAVFLLQTWQVLRLMHRVGAGRLGSFVTAALACWSTYALSNLYNRGAINELIAVALLTAATCAVCRACLVAPGRARLPPLVTGLLCFVLAAGAHPITGVFGGMFFGLATATAWFFSEGRRPLAMGLGAGAVAGAMVLGPWIYAVLQFGPSLYITQHYTSAIFYFPADVDALATRLMPFPYDRRVAASPGMSHFLTPYLDAQVTAGLVILAGFMAVSLFLAWRRRFFLDRAGVAIAVIGWTVFVVLLVVSVSPVLGNGLPGLFHNIQFAYRLVSYLNLALLLAVAGGWLAVSSGKARELVARREAPVLWAILAIAACGLGLKLKHGQASQREAPAISEASTLDLPGEFYGYAAYAVANRPGAAATTIAPPPPLQLAVGHGPEFAQVAAQKFSSAAPQIRQLNVQPFPWNEVRLNGRIAVTADTANAPEGTTIALPAGISEITYTWRPDPTWVWLKALSDVTLLAWLALVAFLHGGAILNHFR